MALFSDGYISNLSDLRDQETGLLDTAHSEAVDLTTKLRLAQEEIGVEVVAFLLEHGRGVCGEESIRQLTHVAVTPALKHWHTFQTLALAYRDVYYNQYNDRYAAKWKEYSRLGRSSASLLFDSGVGVVLDPVERAAAPVLNWAPGTMTAGTYYVRASWVSATGTEGTPSETAALVTEESTQLVVTPPAAPAKAAGWNVYAGVVAGETTLQNDSPLAPGSSWILPVTGLRTGRKPEEGQSPDVYVTISRTFRRG